jgi:hypothetical protein
MVKLEERPYEICMSVSIYVEKNVLNILRIDKSSGGGMGAELSPVTKLGVTMLLYNFLACNIFSSHCPFVELLIIGYTKQLGDIYTWGQ